MENASVTLSHAYLKDAPILVLDEATAFIDQKVRLAFNRHSQNLRGKDADWQSTQRISTVLILTKIVVMDRNVREHATDLLGFVMPSPHGRKHISQWGTMVEEVA